MAVFDVNKLKLFNLSVEEYVIVDIPLENFETDSCSKTLQVRYTGSKSQNIEIVEYLHVEHKTRHYGEGESVEDDNYDDIPDIDDILSNDHDTIDIDERLLENEVNDAINSSIF